MRVLQLAGGHDSRIDRDAAFFGCRDDTIVEARRDDELCARIDCGVGLIYGEDRASASDHFRYLVRYTLQALECPIGPKYDFCDSKPTGSQSPGNLHGDSRVVRLYEWYNRCRLKRVVNIGGHENYSLIDKFHIWNSAPHLCCMDDCALHRQDIVA
jgi:hypothetical protein